MKLHVVAFDIPYPADYGGVIDVFYKLKHLNNAGYQITLHCFQYGHRKPDRALEALTTNTFYYPRKKSILDFFSIIPFIAKSRANALLLERLQSDAAPIIFEGLHCAYYLAHSSLSLRQKVVRMHNVEWRYYAHLATMTTNVLEKIYFITESWKLKRYEKNILATALKLKIWTISSSDTAYFSALPTSHEVIHIGPFHPFHQVESRLGKGDYVLFHGNLSVKDNELAALALIENIFAKNVFHFVIAGKSPSELLQKTVALYPNITLVADPDDCNMSTLIEQAHINILWSFQAEGIKLKLFHALYVGRFVLCNTNVAAHFDTDLSFIVVDDFGRVGYELERFFGKNFDISMLEERKKTLAAHDTKNAINI